MANTFTFNLHKWKKGENGQSGKFVNEVIKKFGLEEGGRVQQIIDAEFLRNVEPYVPMDINGLYENPGNLVNSGIIDTVIGSGEIVWSTPYARKLYYHDKYNYQGAPMKGAYWADRYLQDGGLDQLEQIAGMALNDKISIDGLKPFSTSNISEDLK